MRLTGRDHYHDIISYASIYNFTQTINFFFVYFYKLHVKRSYNHVRRTWVSINVTIIIKSHYLARFMFFISFKEFFKQLRFFRFDEIY